MIGIPFFLWLLKSFDFGHIEQLFALLAVAGLIIFLVNYNKKRTTIIVASDVLIFILLASPIAERMIVVPIGLFNYLAFIIPVTIFVIFYAASFLPADKMNDR